MLRLPFVVILLLCAVTVSFGQSKKNKKGKSQPTQQQSSSLAPYYPEKDYAPKAEKKKKKSSKPTYTAEDKYYDRVGEVSKAQRKAEKEMLKPQYSDPTYFGHKRKPKKRPPHKMKFCKECEIRH
jgi:hypothetical protein